MGGDYSRYEVVEYGHSDHEGSKGHLNLHYQENCTNAYMLVYVREKDIPTVMAESEVPENLGEIFFGEDMKKQSIKDDY